MRRIAAVLTLALLALGLPVLSSAAQAASGPTNVCSDIMSGTPSVKTGTHCGGYFQTSAATGQSTLLAWQVYTPDPAKFGPGPYPTVLDYSGYEPATTFFDGIKDTFLNQGYAVAGVNVRGTGCSGGQVRLLRAGRVAGRLRRHRVPGCPAVEQRWPRRRDGRQVLPRDHARLRRAAAAAAPAGDRPRRVLLRLLPRRRLPRRHPERRLRRRLEPRLAAGQHRRPGLRRPAGPRPELHRRPRSTTRRARRTTRSSR